METKARGINIKHFKPPWIYLLNSATKKFMLRCTSPSWVPVHCKNTNTHFSGHLELNRQGFTSNLHFKSSTATVLLSEVLRVHKKSAFKTTAIRHWFLKTDAWYNCVGLLLEEVIFLPVHVVLITAREIRTTACYWVKIDNLLWLSAIPSLPWVSLQSKTDHQPQEDKPWITDAFIIEVISSFL